MINSLYFEKFPTLSVDDKYYLREQSLEDVEAFFEYYTDPDVAKHILATNPQNIEQARAEIQHCRNLFYHRHGIYWTLARRDNDKMIGAVGLYINNHHHRAEICYDLAKKHWRKGIMSKAIRVVMEYSFRHIGLNRIEAVTVKRNVASINILKKLGFVHEGTLHGYRFFKGKSHDVEMLAITPALMAQRLAKKGKLANFM